MKYLDFCLKSILLLLSVLICPTCNKDEANTQKELQRKCKTCTPFVIHGYFNLGYEASKFVSANTGIGVEYLVLIYTEFEEIGLEILGEGLTLPTTSDSTLLRAKRKFFPYSIRSKFACVEKKTNQFCFNKLDDKDIFVAEMSFDTFYIHFLEVATFTAIKDNSLDGYSLCNTVEKWAEKQLKKPSVAKQLAILNENTERPIFDRRITNLVGNFAQNAAFKLVYSVNNDSIKKTDINTPSKIRVIDLYVNLSYLKVGAGEKPISQKRIYMGSAVTAEQ